MLLLKLFEKLDFNEFHRELQLDNGSYAVIIPFRQESAMKKTFEKQQQYIKMMA